MIIIAIPTKNTINHGHPEGNKDALKKRGRNLSVGSDHRSNPLEVVENYKQQPNTQTTTSFYIE